MLAPAHLSALPVHLLATASTILQIPALMASHLPEKALSQEHLPAQVMLYLVVRKLEVELKPKPELELELESVPPPVPAQMVQMVVGEQESPQAS